MMKKIALACISLIVLAACTVLPPRPNEEPDVNPATANEIRSSRPRAKPAEAADLSPLASSNTAFALDLYHLLAAEDSGNLFFSPYSISQALAMTYAGARGQTAEQMAGTLRFTQPIDDIHSGFNTLDQILTREAQPTEYEDEPFRLEIANALWGQQGYPFRSAFLDTLAENYGAGLQTVDFTTDPNGSRELINEWVSRATAERIQNLLGPGTISTDTRMVLTNAIYFKAGWLDPFEAEYTRDQPFYVTPAAPVDVPMMQQTDFFAYGEGELGGTAYQAVALPYEGRSMRMVIILPQTGELVAFEQALDGLGLEMLLAGLSHQEVELDLPRFRSESQFGLSSALRKLGMVDAFEYGMADFSGMDGSRELYISDVIHKAFVEVDEAGTEAAAATAVIMPAGAMPEEQPPVPMLVDHPFLFLIQDQESGTVLFLGRIVQP